MDDYSRKLWIYLLKNKTEALSRFKQWCAEVELERNNSVKCLRTGNGLEFLSSEFQEFYKMNGMKRQDCPWNSTTKWSYRENE